VRGRVGTPWGQYVGLLVLAAATVVLCYLALSGTLSGDPDADGATDPTVTSSPTGSVTDDPTSEPTDDPTVGESSSPPLLAEPPKVRDQRRKDFTEGDDTLPDGAQIVDGGGNESGLVLTKAGLTHGNPTSGSFAAGIVETKFESDVRALGFRVRFATVEDSGAVTLVAWQNSLAAAFGAGASTAPASGFRLVATPGEWTLSVLDGSESVLAEGTYDYSGDAETFEIVRDGTQVWVIDPTGARTTANDPRVAEFAGPWASWGVTEFGVGEQPATIEALWGG